MSQHNPSRTNDLRHAPDPNESRVLVENEIVGIYIIRDERFSYVNPRFAEIFGYTPEEMLALSSVEAVVAKESRPLVAQRIRSQMEGQAASSHYEFTGVRKDGTPIRVEVFGGLMTIEGRTAIIGTLIDAREHRRQENRLKRSLELHIALNEILRLSLLAAPVEDILGKALDVLLAVPWISTQSGAIFLVEKKDELSLKVQRGLPPAVQSTCARVPFGRCLCGKAAQSGEFIHVNSLDERHENAYPDIRSHGHYIIPVTSAGKTLGVIVLYLEPGHFRHAGEKPFLLAVAQILAGIIERKETEASLHRSLATLRQAQKMDAIGRFAGGVVHDFRNFITLITGFSALLCEDLPEGPWKESAQAIHKAAGSAAALTEGLLTFSRESPLLPQEIDVNERVTTTADLLRHMLGSAIKVVLNLEPAVAKTIFDPIQMQQVLINLAANAHDAMPQGGTLTFKTGNARLGAGGAGSHGLKPGDYVLIEVSDTGEGMSEEVRLKVFEPFFTTKPPGKGTGLGLATVYGIVKQSGGAIDVESSPGDGARFLIHLPVAGGQRTVLMREGGQ